MKLTIPEAQQRQRETTDVIHWRPNAQRVVTGEGMPGHTQYVPFEELKAEEHYAEVLEFLPG